MISRIKIILLISISLFTVGLFAQVERTEQEIIKDKQRVKHVYNFANYIYWDNLEAAPSFVIAVLGELEDNLFSEFLLKAGTGKIKGLDVKIKYFKSIAEISQTHILYVHERQGLDLNSILEKAYLNNTLVVSENYPFHTSMINFIDLGSSFNFEMDQNKIKKAKLLVDPELITFSVQKTTDWEELYALIQKERDVVKEQKLKLASLRNAIGEQQDLVDDQKKNLIIQSEKIDVQKVEIENKKNKLNELLYSVNIKNKISDTLQLLLEKKTLSVEEQNSLINNQSNVLQEQENEIKIQENKILNHKEEINKQLEQIELQKIINYGLVIFFILAVLFGIYVYKNNQREKKDKLALKAKNEDLAALNKSLDSFVYHVSHDLKAPIINIKNMLIMLQNNIGDMEDTNVPQIITYMEKSTTRLEDTIVDLLELARIEKNHENKYKINLTELFKEVIENASELIKDAKADIISDFEECNMLLGTNPEITSVFQNLLSNSLKYRSPNRLLEVNIKTRIKDNMCELIYEDNGVGIDLDKYGKKLFKMFHRFNTDNSIKGTGVGMYIVNKLIQNYDGNIRLKSEVDKGLKYIINIPINID